MSKSKEELNTLKKEVETVNKIIRELTPEELEKVNGGVDTDPLGSWSLKEAYLKGGGVSQLIN